MVTSKDSENNSKYTLNGYTNLIFVLTFHIYSVYRLYRYRIRAKSVKGWVLGCPDLPTVNLI